jgi:Putative protein-S-isoprenylcysteine methyltransferase
MNALTWIGYCWIAVGLVWVAGLAYTKKVAQRMPMGPRFFQIALGILGIVLISSRAFDVGWMADSLISDSRVLSLAGWIGLTLTALGCIFACWARLALGGNWSGEATIKNDHELIMKGPYALTRHPIYTGLLVAAAGTALAVSKWHAIVGFTLVALMLMLKIGQEERLLTRQFPESYPAYKRRVKALIPGLL